MTEKYVMEKQVGGKHYKKHKIQPWDIIDEYNLNYYEGNALKYLLREKENRVEDLGKSIHYLEKEILNLNYLEEEPNELTTSSKESRKKDDEDFEEKWFGTSVGRAEEWKDTELSTGSSSIQERADSNSEERTTGCDTSSLINEGTGHSDKLSQRDEAFTVTEVRSDHSGRSPQVGRRVSEILDALEGIEKTIRHLRYDFQFRDVNSRDLCEPLSHVGSQLTITLEKIRNLQ